jgi:poly-gamma-glutamate synthesis protein (capsule biosynthesis protein)
MPRRDWAKNQFDAQAAAALLCCVSAAVASGVVMAYGSPSAALRGPGAGHRVIAAAEQIDLAPRHASTAEIRKLTAADFREARLAAPPDDGIALVAVGDIMLSRTVDARMDRWGRDYPFRKTAAFLDSADIAFGNLETPIIAGPPVKSGEMSFHADPGVEEDLAASGFDVLSLANNHTPNRGEAGLERTEELLKSAGIAFAGAGMGDDIAPAVIESKGVRFAFLAYTDPALVPVSYGASDGRRGTVFMDLGVMIKDVAAARRDADVVIVSMHAGIEYRAKPDSKQVEFAHAAIDAGADLVIGHHPHVVQPIERYKGGLIFYSLGNFIFDQDWSRETLDGLAVRLVFDGASLSRAELFPVSIDESQPRLAAGTDADRVFARLGPETEEFDTFVWDAASRSPRAYSAREVVPEASYAGRSVRLEPARAESGDVGDGFALKDGRLRLLTEGATAWQSPDDAWVDSWHLADIDGDGTGELAVSAWLPGRFGESKPFWLSDDPTEMTSRLLVYDMRGGLPEPRWFSSGLARPNCLVEFSDLDQDGSAELIAHEGDYADSPQCRERRISVWRWNGWGFTNIWTGPDAEPGSPDTSFEPFSLP